jgi:hypothetical protein
MKKSEVTIGNVYCAKVSNQLVDVRIDAESRHGGWDATNLLTGRKVRIRSAQRLARGARMRPIVVGPLVRRAIAQADASEVDPRAAPPPPATPVATTASRPMSALDAAARVLSEAARAMTAREVVEAAAAAGYWASPNGKTPHATIASAIGREIAAKAEAARFRRAGAGRFIRA